MASHRRARGTLSDDAASVSEVAPPRVYLFDQPERHYVTLVYPTR